MRHVVGDVSEATWTSHSSTPPAGRKAPAGSIPTHWHRTYLRTICRGLSRLSGGAKANDVPLFLTEELIYCFGKSLAGLTSRQGASEHLAKEKVSGKNGLLCLQPDAQPRCCVLTGFRFNWFPCPCAAPPWADSTHILWLCTFVGGRWSPTEGKIVFSYYIYLWIYFLMSLACSAHLQQHIRCFRVWAAI